MGDPSLRYYKFRAPRDVVTGFDKEDVHYLFLQAVKSNFYIEDLELKWTCLEGKGVDTKIVNRNKLWKKLKNLLQKAKEGTIDDRIWPSVLAKCKTEPDLVFLACKQHVLLVLSTGRTARLDK